MSRDLVIHDKSYCHFVYDGIDLQTKEMRREIQPELLIKYTPNNLKNDLQRNNLLEAEGQVIQIAKDVFFNINVRLSSQAARKHYGNIEKGYKLKIKMISGDAIELIAQNSSDGAVDGDTSLGVYAVQYAIGKKESSRLSKSDIDKISIQWSSGLEEYTIYQTDFFINQLRCLNQAKQN